jgi:hypothetical protein
LDRSLQVALLHLLVSLITRCDRAGKIADRDARIARLECRAAELIIKASRRINKVFIRAIV